jgi:hypothetical protein
MNGSRPLIIALALVIVTAAPSLAAKTAFRIDSLYWRDPHLFVNFIGCRDVTDTPIAGFSFNGSTNTPIQTDGNGDGLLDQNYVFVFNPLDQLNLNGPVTFMTGLLCSPPAWQSACWPGPPPIIYTSTYNNNIAINCLDIIPGTVVHSYTPAITLPSPTPECFSMFVSVLYLNLGGIPLALHNVGVGATYDGNPATKLVNGLIRGFIYETDANNTILPASMPLVGGQPLSILFPGGAGNCAAWSDKEIVDPGLNLAGWYVYLNFTANKVTWYDSPVAVRDGAPALTLDAPHPNPFNPSTEIHYVLPRAGSVQVTVYDASGRIVSELVNEAQVQGDHGVHWNGRDLHGSMVGSGVYFVKLTANGETRTQKMVLLK